MKAQVLLDTFFTRYDYEDCMAYYALKDDNHVITLEGRHMTEMLSLANVEDDGTLLFFCVDPEQDPVIHAISGESEVEVKIYEKLDMEEVDIIVDPTS